MAVLPANQVCVIVVAILAACRNEARKPAEAGEVVATEVVCKQSFPGGTTTGGKYSCEVALEQFLVEHADERILGVIPVEAATLPEPENATDLVKPGTQRLIVIHHDGTGHGTLAKELDVRGLVCDDGSKPIRLRPQDCRDVLHATLEYYDLDRPVVWVPLTGAATPSGDEPGTQVILVLEPRKVIPPASGP